MDNAHTELWRIAKTLKNQALTIPPLVKEDNKLTASVVEQCNELAVAFSKNMGLTVDWEDADINRSVTTSMNILNTSTDLCLPQLTRPREINRYIQRLHNRKAPGVDKIHNILLKNVPIKCIVLLTKIFNACFKLHYFPIAWKTAKVIALPKPGKDHKKQSVIVQ